MLDVKQKEWIDRQLSQIDGFVKVKGLLNLEDEDWEWIVNFTDGITGMIESKCTSITTIRDARNRVLDKIEALEIAYKQAKAAI